MTTFSFGGSPPRALLSSPPAPHHDLKGRMRHWLSEMFHCLLLVIVLHANTLLSALLNQTFVCLSLELSDHLSNWEPRRAPSELCGLRRASGVVGKKKIIQGHWVWSHFLAQVIPVCHPTFACHVTSYIPLVRLVIARDEGFTERIFCVKYLITIIRTKIPHFNCSLWSE